MDALEQQHQTHQTGYDALASLASKASYLHTDMKVTDPFFLHRLGHYQEYTTGS